MTSIEKIRELIKIKIGLNVIDNDLSNFHSMILEYLSDNEIESIDKLLILIDTNRTELILLAEKLLNHETWFFKDKELYETIIQYINDNEFIKNSQIIRILSIACSSGEEAYSIAMSLNNSGLNSKDFTIDGVDISPTAIETAKQAVYNSDSIKYMDMNLTEKYFRKAEELVILNPKIAHLVNFHKANIIESNFFSNRKKYDIIVTKNIFNILTNEAVNKLLNNISRILTENGIVITTENECCYFQNPKFKKTNISSTTYSLNSTETQLKQNNSKIKRNRIGALQKVFRFNKNINELKTQYSETMNYNKSDSQLYNQIQQLILLRQYDRAKDFCDEIINENIQNPEIFYLLGNIYERQNDTEQAEEFYHKALYLEPYHYDTLIKLITLFENKGWIDRAELLKKRIEKITGKQ